jgi:hypothetical protein
MASLRSGLSRTLSGIKAPGRCRFLSYNSSNTAPPALGTPFHLAIPVHNLEVATHFYGEIMGCQKGRSSKKWQDFSLGGHQIVCHWVGEDYRCIDYFNPVDGDEVGLKKKTKSCLL